MENSKELTRVDEDWQVLSNEGADILMGEKIRPPPVKKDRSGANGAQG